MAKPFDTSHSPARDPSLAEAPILHVDLDAFFASVEILDDPSLRGRPVAVGGAGERGVVASASYEARRFGVYSAMPSVIAMRRCPQLIILPGRFDRYEEYSRRFHAIVMDLTPDFEPLGLDELFCDLSSLTRLNRRPFSEAHHLRQRIRDELHIESGVGLGPNKLFAKLASKRAKPHVDNGVLVPGPGVFFMAQEERLPWLRSQNVRALWGVGPATAERLHRLGIKTVGDLAELSEEVLRSHVGPAMAHSLYEMARGRDDRAVTPNRVTKSIGHEETFARSAIGRDEVVTHARRHSAVVARALRASDQVARTISIVVRFDDLSSITRAQSLNFGIDDDGAVATIAVALVDAVDLRGPVRLFGVSASGLAPRQENQLQLTFSFGDGGSEQQSRDLQASRGALNDAVDDLRRRFGRAVIGQASDILDGEIDVGVQRGRHAFGPDTDDSAAQRP